MQTPDALQQRRDHLGVAGLGGDRESAGQIAQRAPTKCAVSPVRRARDIKVGRRQRERLGSAGRVPHQGLSARELRQRQRLGEPDATTPGAASRQHVTVLGPPLQGTAQRPEPGGIDRLIRARSGSGAPAGRPVD